MRKPSCPLLDTPDHVVRSQVVDLTSQFDHPALFRGRVHDEPRVDGDAMSADPGARLQDFHPRVVVGQFDQLPNVDIELLANQGKLVGKRDADVACSIFSEFGHLGGPGVRNQAFGPEKSAVQRRRYPGAFGGHAADNAVVVNQF